MDDPQRNYGDRERHGDVTATLTDFYGGRRRPAAIMITIFLLTVEFEGVLVLLPQGSVGDADYLLPRCLWDRFTSRDLLIIAPPLPLFARWRSMTIRHVPVTFGG